MTSREEVSADELSALLNAEIDEDEGTDNTLTVYDFLSDEEVDTLQDVAGLFASNATKSLANLLHTDVRVTTPSLLVITKDKIRNEITHHVVVYTNFQAGVKGTNLLFVESEEVKKLRDLISNTEPEEELTGSQLTIFKPLFEEVYENLSNRLSEEASKMVDIAPPIIDLVEGGSVEINEEIFIGTQIEVSYQDQTFSALRVFPISFVKDLTELIKTHPAASYHTGSGETDTKESVTTTREKAVDAYMDNNQIKGEPKSSQSPDVQSIQFPTLEGNIPLGQMDVANLGLLLDVPLQVTVELGRTRKVVKDILELSQGSILELDKLAGEPVDILVNGKRIAKGEVVVIEENFGVRVTDIVSQADRLKNINN
ncbi:flagellar motor switch phosphatase FliY [Niallia taxi]|uniref:flagellar motor switch phosphatase FliY n=1 Tax=Niallia taxi TaxID=2499688 RepID=UPI0015F69E3D|nr:flagellar motor switch phosphatase FliY [Niallia taxi]